MCYLLINYAKEETCTNNIGHQTKYTSINVAIETHFFKKVANRPEFDPGTCLPF